MNVLNISIAIKSQLDTSLFYDLAVKCLCVFNSEQKSEVESLLKNIIFSTQFYPSEILLKNLDINRRNTNLEVSLNNLDDILNVYIKVLGLNNVNIHIVKCVVLLTNTSVYFSSFHIEFTKFHIK